MFSFCYIFNFLLKWTFRYKPETSLCGKSYQMGLGPKGVPTSFRYLTPVKAFIFPISTLCFLSFSVRECKATLETKEHSPRNIVWNLEIRCFGSLNFRRQLYKLPRNGFGVPLGAISRLNRNQFNFYLNQFYLSSVTWGVVIQSPEPKAHVSNRASRIELEFRSVGF